MRRSAKWLGPLALTLLILFFGTSVSSQGTGQAVTLDQLKQTNVSLEFVGFEFASGLNRDASGKPNGNGLEMVQAQWAGSGFIVQPDGTIITNYHVARRTLGGRAVFEDGSSYDINQIKVYDPVNDIAVMKIKAQKAFPTVKLGNSDAINVMDRVLAVGNALGQHMAVTEGMINQVFVDDNNVRYQLRHSATIAPGNSGGALYRGDEVIGINVSGRLGLSIYYSIPINVAKPLLDPKYQVVPLTQAFPADPNAIFKRAHQIFVQNGQAPAGTKQGPGTAAWTMSVQHLQDLLFEVKSPGRNLALLVVDPQQNQPLGLGDLNQVDTDYLLLSPQQDGQVAVYVLNYDNKPANFALAAYQIIW